MVDHVWKPSWTKFVTWIYGLPAAMFILFDKISSWAGDTTVKQAISELHVPEWLPQTLIALALVHYVAHGRSDD